MSSKIWHGFSQRTWVQSIACAFITALHQAYQFWSRHAFRRLLAVVFSAFFLVVTTHAVIAQGSSVPRPKVILISLDGATPGLMNEYLKTGVLDSNTGLGLLKRRGVVAQRNVTCNPSLTAACHVSIGTGSTTVKTDVVANSFHLIASPFTRNVSGFAAPIGGYTVKPVGPAAQPLAEPIWVGLRQHGKKVVAATFPGADGAEITLAGAGTPVLQAATDRTVDYTIPFGAFAGQGAKGFSLTATDFTPAPGQTIGQLEAAGKKSYSPILQKTTPLDTFAIGTVNYTIQVAALDTTNDGSGNYDTLVFFDASTGIQPGPFSLPATGPAYVKASDRASALFYLEGSATKAGTGFYVSTLAPDLTTVRIARYSANAIPRNTPVLADVDDINNNVGFWAPQADFRIPERLSPGFTTFPDADLEAIYEDQVRTFVAYQTRVVLRAIAKNPDADLVLAYIEQPDGSEHQFLAIDPRQATNSTNPNTIGAGQDQAKLARYKTYVQAAYRIANRSVQQIIDTVGTTRKGTPKSNIIVVSDHGFAPFHTAVDFNALLRKNGIDSTKVRAITSGPAANIYINLKGREPDGIVTTEEYIVLQKQVVKILEDFVETNPNYTKRESKPIFDKIHARPLPSDVNDPSFGLGTSQFIGQDSGDVFATLTEGYNFDGTQAPVVPRLGDAPETTPVLSVPNFYGAHGYDPKQLNMSAIFFAAGPNIRRGDLQQVRNIDVVPTINKLLGVESASTVQGKALSIDS
ncbi:alkaline phosphatase family protein [Stenomitos frigidus]|uniref:Phosphodiesterase n=1 Tax=Stenomitos frigidus ULC18 TaxID=2107698 RepID=A0A2T1EHN8_9CYAN|nr:alkaline phosphatase family protein [Stenomitos frigidus]PSB32198.1 phosphodiesterase [Stenomitos frigidus ULC18]